MRWLILLCVFICVLAPPVMGQDTTGAGLLRGTLRREDGTAVAGIELCLTGGRCQRTGSDGGFRFTDLRPGFYSLSGEGFSTGVEVRAGLEGEVELALTGPAVQRQQVDVIDSIYVAPVEIKSSSYLIPSEDVKVSAAALKDVSRFVQTLPGVVFGANDFRNDIVVRGGSPLENLYIVDNVEIPNINHFANFASAGGPVGQFNSELLSDMTFLTGGYPAPYPNRLSSVLQLTQREGRRESIAGQASVGFAGAGGIAEGPLGRKGSWIVSARRSFLDFFTDDIGFGGVPIYINVQGKAVYDVNAENRIWISTIGGRDEIGIRPDAASDEQEADRFNVDFGGWRNGAGLNWQQSFGARGIGLMGLTHSHGSVNSRVNDISFGDALVSRQNSSEDEFTAKYDLTLNVPLFDRVQAGVSSRWFLIDYDLANPLGLQNPFSPEPGRVNRLTVNERLSTDQRSAYVQVSRQIRSRIGITAGGRWDHYSYVGQSRFSPRAGITVRLAEGLSAHASYGRYAQQPFFIYLLASPFNKGLAPMGSEHLVTGIAWTPHRSVRVTVEAYEKRYRDYPVSLEYPEITLASAGDAYGPNFYLFPMTSAGKGRTRGIEFFASKSLAAGLYGQANFAIAKASHAALDGAMRPGGFDSRYVLNLSGGYRFRTEWEFALRYALISGRPYTPFDIELSTAQNRGIFDLDRVNAVRAPAYARFDFRVDRYLKFSSGMLDIYGGLQNAFNRENFLAEVWNFRANQPKTMSQMGPFPIIGMEWRFR